MSQRLSDDDQELIATALAYLAWVCFERRCRVVLDDCVVYSCTVLPDDADIRETDKYFRCVASQISPEAAAVNILRDLCAELGQDLASQR